MVWRLGDSGEEVKEIQLMLAKLGYALKGTGYFGPATDTAVTDFQKTMGLRADGIVGQLTLGALEKAIPGRIPETSEPLWVLYGKSLLNTKERPGEANNLAILAWAKEEGGSISKTYKKDSIPWCALFINHILTKQGLKGTETLWALDWSTNLKKWPHLKLQGPAVGAIAAMKRSGGGHVIAVVGKDQHGNIMGLGGNQADEVSIRPFPLSRLDQGFGWPEGVPLPTLVGIKSLPIVSSNGRVSSNEA